MCVCVCVDVCGGDRWVGCYTRKFRRSAARRRLSSSLACALRFAGMSFAKFARRNFFILGREIASLSLSLSLSLSSSSSYYSCIHYIRVYERIQYILREYFEISLKWRWMEYFIPVSVRHFFSNAMLTMEMAFKSSSWVYTNIKRRTRERYNRYTGSGYIYFVGRSREAPFWSRQRASHMRAYAVDSNLIYTFHVLK